MIRIKPSKRNTNKHTEAGMELLENSINEVGVIESISVTKQGTIISGHARKEKFDKKGFVPKEITLAENEYPVIVRNDIEDNTDTYYKAQILANTTAHQNYNLDVEEIEVIAEEYDLDLEELGIEVEDADLSDDLETQFSNENYSDKNKEIDIDGFEDELVLKLKYTEAEYNIVKEQLLKIAPTPEQAIWILINGDKHTEA
jgi:hypothetical protein|nr:MAG TPA: hypothetical protein [Caudoviricetes sp.]